MTRLFIRICYNCKSAFIATEYNEGDRHIDTNNKFNSYCINTLNWAPVKINTICVALTRLGFVING